MAETSKTEPTIEDLQNQILALQAEREQLKKDSESMKEQVITLKDSLTQSRDLNSKLLHKLPNSFEDSIEPEQESHEETREEFIDSFISIGVENLKKIYGQDCLNKKE